MLAEVQPVTAARCRGRLPLRLVATSGETGSLSFSCDPAAHEGPVERFAGLVLSSRRSITKEKASDAIAKAQHVVDVIERAIAVELGAAPSP